MIKSYSNFLFNLNLSSDIIKNFRINCETVFSEKLLSIHGTAPEDILFKYRKPCETFYRLADSIKVTNRILNSFIVYLINL
jgi:hypothetical protein